MKYRTLPRFDRELKRLTNAERKQFDEALSLFITSCKHFDKHPKAFIWPARLRFEKLVGHDDIYAITWSFKRPDGRAAFRMKRMDGELWVIWRRVGRHDIYKEP